MFPTPTHGERSTNIPDREIYPNAPLQFVAFEARIPYVPQLASQDGTSAIYAALKDVVPIVHGPSAPSIELGPAGGFALAASSGGPFRMLDRRRQLSVTVLPTAVIIETSSYIHFEAFAEIVEHVLRAVTQVASPAGIQRVGLRYIDEIRVVDVSRVSDWETYINPSLIPALHIEDGYEPERTESLAEFVINERQRTVMRFGAMQGFVVDPNGLLKLKRTETGPFFLIDLDSSWLADEADTPEFSVDAVLATCSDLRVPVRAIFEASITDRLRDDVLRKEVKLDD